MPSPVSPDAGVPEHQPDPHRQSHRPQSGQFQSGQFQSGQFQASRPRSGQLPTRSGANPLPPVPPREPARDDGRGRGRDGGRTTKRDWIWSVVAFLVAAGVITAVALHFFGPDGAEDAGATWAVNACAGPEPTGGDATNETEAYRPLPCDDPDATVTILDIQDAVRVEQVHCPAGADIVFQKDGQAGGNTQAVCARNLSDDHPGDPGNGGGQLVTGDCVDEDGTEVACSSNGARKVTGLIVGSSECPDGTKDKLELGFDAARSYETICLGG
ncbi:hypothetical protein [Promicromonospora soli]|nr:hypothetical protein [Promicromonospora soli]